ncbi:MAG: glycosyltransferase family 4 protein [Bacteroidales bacterium]|nr:glycosyltransferase family 4 protein [Bacteroidales bacterium]
MKIAVTGTRGIPNILGGVETHCEELYPIIASMGYEVTLIRRSCYITANNKTDSYKGVNLKDIYAPRKKSLEAIIHTFLAVLYAKKIKADIIHIHAIGPSIMVPFARLLGLKVVITHHGPDYDRKKWGYLAKFALKTGEKWGVKYANKVIVISEVIKEIVKKKYNRNDAHLIFNGVNIPSKINTTDYISSFGLKSKKYLLTAGRFVEEKNFDLLIKSFSGLKQKEYQLVIAGDADHETEYSIKLKKLAQEHHVILTGFIKGAQLNEIFSHAALFVLPSSHEGLPIALLEAMSYNLDVLVSDIPANKLQELDSSDYFISGSPDDLQNKLKSKLSKIQINRNYDLDSYQWPSIAVQTCSIYKALICGDKGY